MPGTTSQNIYSVPEGYFEDLASSILRSINAENGSSLLSQLPKSNPYKVPVGYFDELADHVLNSLRNHPDHLNSREELETLSPLLSSLKKEPVFSVPTGYFDHFSVETNHKQPAKVVGMFRSKILRFAAAAVVTGVVVVTGFIIYKNGRGNHATPEKIMAKVQKDVKKIDDVKQLDNLAEFIDAGLNEKEVATTKTIKINDADRLLKDVSADELKEFSEESKDIQDVMMTN